MTATDLSLLRRRPQARTLGHGAWRLAATTALVGSALACAVDSGGDGPRLGATIETPLGSRPDRFRAVIVDERDDVSTQDCPGSNDGDRIQCTPAGIDVRDEPRVRQITVKAPGYAWQTVSTSGTDREAEPTVALEALEPFEQNEDYATGLDAETGLDSFLSLAVPVDTELGPSLSVKFLITDVKTSPRVYLQNTRLHPLHYDFARTVLGQAGTVSEFEDATYRGAERTALAGTLVAYPDLEFESRAAHGALRAPITLNLFPSDDADPDQVREAHRLLEERLLLADPSEGAYRLVYSPAGERQQEELLEAAPRFDAVDALYTDPAELYAGVDQQILNPGLAYGTLRRFTPDELARAVLSTQDIVVLTRLPNELPVVGGTITAELQTPLAHVNVAARARGTPNLALRDADDDPRVAPLLGRLVRFEVTGAGFSLTEATSAEAEAFWDAQARDPFVPASDVDDHGLPSLEEVHFADSIYCGVKAANLAELRQLLGDEAPTGFVVPFRAYDQHLSTVTATAALCAEARGDCALEGRDEALCAAAFERCAASAEDGDSLYGYAARLLADEDFARDTPLREACLDSLVYLVRHGPVDRDFADALDARVAEVFGTAQVRLRSSTNAEDLPNFSGAGLYDSVSAVASGDDRASSEIRKVWASVWSFRAFEERRLWNIDHLAVRMGVAVNQAFDDEAANGVLITQNVTNPGVVGMYVNVQLGEVSVTNPEDGALPEVFTILPSPDGGVQVARQRFSSLSPDLPLLTDDEVSRLYAAAARVQGHFAPLYQRDISLLALDLEFKFHGPERALIIKQARPYATRTASPAE
jgi:pyruvate,water dikinase